MTLICPRWIGKLTGNFEIMNIIGKEFINYYAIKSKGEDDVQGTSYNYDAFIDLYIYNSDVVSRSLFQEFETNTIEIIGNLSEKNISRRRLNIIKTIEKNQDRSSIGNYELRDTKIKMIWKFQRGEEDITIIFKGEILLDGDALKGTFYNNGVVNISERVYYNIDKPLPDPLIKEDNI